MPAPNEHTHTPESSCPEDSKTGLGPDACDFEDCACTGKNLVRFTSPAALLAIAEAGPVSGYEIGDRLRSMPLYGDSGPDSGGLYRTLRRLEALGLVRSHWDTSGNGPARRLYEVTESGSRCLDNWAQTLEGHRAAVTGFLADYRRLRSDR
ncbi:MAG: helix-turn-helix transcriptional regulator [Thermoleophilia bacterium]